MLRTDLRYVPHETTNSISTGSKKKYKGSDGNSLCDMPGPGVYELRYKLDPHYNWDEGEAEANNQGLMRGELRVR